MTKEERAEKWFSNIPNTESITMETKMNICNKVAKKMAIIFFVIFALQFVLLSVFSGGRVFDLLAEFFNKLSEGSHTRNHYRGMALAGWVTFLPIMVLPLIITIMYKKKSLKLEAMKVLDIKQE